jgi:antitoxin component of RelBE/YafQ-DinJ toxin-antitoxin module
MKTNLATKIDPKVRKAMDQVCEDRGLKISFLVETAIREKIEEIEEEEALKQMVVQSLAESGEHTELEYRKLLRKKGL